MAPQFPDQAADQPLGAPVDERELRLADENRSHGSDYTIAIATIRAAVHCDVRRSIHDLEISER
jgi:hypothetical protein